MSATTPPPATPAVLANLTVTDTARGQDKDKPATETEPNKAETDWVAEARKWEKLAKENKAAASKLAAIEEANKSEAQRAADRITALEAEAAEAKASALRFKIAAKFSVSDEDADLFLTGNDEPTLTKQAQRLAARSEDAAKPRTPKPNPAQGKPGSTSGHSTAELFAAAVEDHLS